MVKHDRRQPPRGAREDGAATRRKIVEVAGALFAEQGYAETSSKQITAAAGVNTAAVNYYFGSRENLYAAVLEEVDRRFISLDVLTHLEAGEMSAEAKFRRLIETIITGMSDRAGWPAMLWAREIVNPSPMFTGMVRDGVVEPKIEVLAKIIADITKLTDHTAVLQCIIISLAPCVLLAGFRRDAAITYESLNDIPAEELSGNIVVFALAGLHAFADRYHGHPS